MRRREFIAGLGGAAAWPLAASAQQRVQIIGWLHTQSPQTMRDIVPAFFRGLSEMGFGEGRNVAVEHRWAEGRNDRLPALAADLVGRKVNVIVTGGGGSAARAAKAASTTIPIIFQVGADPAATGLVASLNRPGGNLTGVNSLNGELAPKQLQLLHELLPTATIFGLLVNPTNVGADMLRDTEAAAGALGLQLHVLHASTERDFDTVFATLLRLKAGGLLISADPFLQSRSKQLAPLALHHALPAIAQLRDFVAAGGLMSYGGSIREQLRQVGVFTGRVLQGEKPADLPVQQSTKVELHQHEDRQGARPYHPGNAVGHR